MKRQWAISILLLLAMQFIYQICNANLYIVFYATHKGKTGHIGIGVSKYIIYSNEIETDGISKEVFDTTKANDILYYDLWPNEDQFSVWNTGRNIKAEYYKLPVNADDEITLTALYQKGIPHKEYYPCDGILQITTTWQQDKRMEEILDSLIDSKRKFNGRNYNCADFVEQSLEILFQINIKAKEFIGVGWSSTPNKLFRKILKLPDVFVIKDAGKKASGSFLKERVLYKIFKAERIST